MPAGRPSTYKEEYCDTVIECGRDGMGKAEMASKLGISRVTLDDWIGKHPEFSYAIKRAQDESQAWWEQRGRAATFGGVDGFNATAFIFQMKNRFRDDYSDTIKQELTGKDGGAIQTDDKGAAKVMAYIDAVRSRATGSPAD